eukprot:gene11490-13581_t
MQETLLHESDGLIFQPAKDPYTPFTCNELLKWKPADMNSVDFYLKATPGAAPQLCIGGSRGETIPVDEKLIGFPPGVDVTTFHGTIIECAWNKMDKAWRYMRVRTDKDTPNHESVYHKVWESITDDITAAKLMVIIQGIVELLVQHLPCQRNLVHDEEEDVLVVINNE